MADIAGRTLLHLAASPVELLTAWGEGGQPGGAATELAPAFAEPLVALNSGGDPSSRGRWSVLAPIRHHPPLNTLEALRAALPNTAARPDLLADADAPPFTGGFIGFISYEFGNVLEPAAGRGTRSATPLPWPNLQFHRCDAALVYDHHRSQWWAVGSPRERAVLAQTAAELSFSAAQPESFVLSPLRSRTGRASFERDVARIVEYIRAGDIFQANLAHTLTGRFVGSPRHFFAALMKSAAPWYGAYLDVLQSTSQPQPRRVICSASPELFVAYQPHTRRVVTRPMKGTVPANAGETALRESEKDRAELNMIIDLMRNDIGRVSAPASVRVDDARAIELHGHGHGHGIGAASVYQGVATVSGTLAAGLDVIDLLRATFPAGSITGAPKIRAMQVIRELEPADRGPYCGAIGFISDSGHAAFSVAIRTALLTSESSTQGATSAGTLRGTCEYSVGAGIVADSVPALEWQETLAKARIISGLASGGIE